MGEAADEFSRIDFPKLYGVVTRTTEHALPITEDLNFRERASMLKASDPDFVDMSDDLRTND